MSLQNKTILITRQREQSEEFVAEIERRGGRAVVFPLIRITEPDSWDSCDTVLQRLAEYDGLILTSENGVERFFKRCSQKGIQLSAFRKLPIYAVGEKTRRAIERQGLQVRYVPEKFTSASLAKYFKSVEVRSKHFLYPRGNLGNSDLIQYLSDLGATVEPVIVYNNVELDKNSRDELYKQLRSESIDVITFASPSAAINFLKVIPLKKVQQLKRPPKVAVIGPTTKEAVLKLGLRPDIVAKKSTVSGLVESIEAYYDAITQ